MVIRYSRLYSNEIVNVDWARLVKSRLPISFLRQHLWLLFIAIFIPDPEHYLSSTDFDYGVIVDCGSSGSRAHIFRWEQQSSVNQIEFVKDKLSDKPLSKHITPGLSSFKDNPDKASDYMEPLMNFISGSIPKQKHFDTPIYFLATAGMRLLDDHTQKRLLSDITNDLKIKFDFSKIESQVISGTLEGVYSWLSLNMKRKSSTSSWKSQSYGMIEMGGASTQVTFELDPLTEDTIKKNLKNTDELSTFESEQVTLKLGNSNSIKLFATTFLGLGVNSARGAAVDLLVRGYLNGTEGFDPKRADHILLDIVLKDPCLTMGSKETLSRPILLMRHSNHSIGTVIKQYEETFEVNLEGTGDFLSCTQLLERVLSIVKTEKLHCQPTRHACPVKLLGTDFIPFMSYPFVGLSEMFFTTNEMINASGLFDRARILHETKRICSMQYNKLMEMFPRGKVSWADRVLYECFKASWLLTLLHRSGFRMPVDYDNFRTLDQLDEEEVDWTKGAMIARALDSVSII